MRVMMRASAVLSMPDISALGRPHICLRRVVDHSYNLGIHIHCMDSESRLLMRPLPTLNVRLRRARTRRTDGLWQTSDRNSQFDFLWLGNLHIFGLFYLAQVRT